MRRLLASLFLIAPTVALGAPSMPKTEALNHPLAGVIVDVRAGERLSGPDALATALSQADVTVLGETHDNPEHHVAQAWIVETIQPTALAFEMISETREGRLSRLRAAGADEAALEEALEWTKSGWPDFSMYHPILAAAPDAVVTGGAIGREEARLAMTLGAAIAAKGTIGASAALYGLDEALPDDVLADAASEKLASHCNAIPSHVALLMVEAQRLRDAAFADAVLRARAQGNDGPVALIAGSGHARSDRGAPASLNTARPDLKVASLAMVELVDGAEDWRAYLQRDPSGEPVVDYVWFTAGAERADPCIAFREQMKN